MMATDDGFMMVGCASKWWLVLMVHGNEDSLWLILVHHGEQQEWQLDKLVLLMANG